jgi:hypothetical protein
MESKLSILLYSKYSSLSKKLINKINQSGIDFKSEFSIQNLCIDNKKIRSRIVNNAKIPITTVPCLLIIFPDGGIEKYDGLGIFEWFDDIIVQHTKRYEQSTENPIQYNLEQEIIYDQNIKKGKVSIKEPPIVKKKPVNTLVTSIDDLESESESDKEEEEEEEEEEEIYNRHRSIKPIARVRKDESSYDDSKELFENDRADDRLEIPVAGNDAKSKKSADIMSKAKQMQKGREDPKTINNTSI